MPYWVQLSILVVLVAGAVTAALLLPEQRAEIVGAVLIPVFVGLATLVGRLFGRKEGALAERRRITEEHNTVKQREPTEKVEVLRDDESGRVEFEVVLICGTALALLATGFAFGYWAGAASVLR